MQYRFKQNYRVRYDECNLYGVVTPVAALRYLQDIAVVDAEQVKLIGTGDWVAKRTLMEFHTAIPARANIEIQTYPLGFTKVTAWRGYDVFVLGENSATLAIKARTLWVYLDNRGRPLRITPEMLAIWVPSGSTFSLPPEELVWPNLTTQTQISTMASVRFADLDIMGHMNNTAYVELLDNVAWETLAQAAILPHKTASQPVPLRYDIEYLASAKPGDTLQVQTWFRLVEGDSSGQNFERIQRVQCNGTLLVRARSRWQWQRPDQAESNTVPAAFMKLLSSNVQGEQQK